MYNIRRPYGQPSHPDAGASIPTQAKLITIRHPGYDDGNNVLLLLPALDLDRTFHHDTALAACCVLSNNNQSDGFLAEDRTGTKKVDPVSVTLLEGENYYFHVPDRPGYEVVPTFGDWEFPHRNLPTMWQRCEIPRSLGHGLPRSTSSAAAVVSRDLSCRISLHREGTQVAHLVPVSYAAWFASNGISRYALRGTDIGLVSNQTNAILLRSDLHAIFDTYRFTILPKRPAEPDSPDPIFAVHAFDREPESEIVQLYHNVPLQQLSDIAVPFLYARFALTVFDLFKTSGFLNMGLSRTLRVRSTDGGFAAKRFSAAECQEIVRRTGSRSVSPKKRKPVESGLEESCLADDDDDDDDDDAIADECVDIPPRGRKRRRTSSMEGRYYYPSPSSQPNVSFRPGGQVDVKASTSVC